MPLASIAPPPPAVQVGIDEDHQLVLVSIVGPATGTLVSGCISALFRQRPDLAAYDMLYDLTAYSGDVAADDIDPIIEAYAESGPDLSIPCRTAFVTRDRFFQYWATAMDEQFPGREHRAFPQLPPALQFLGEPLELRRRRI